MSESAKPTAKVLFRIEEDDGSANIETLWAFDLGDDHYRLDNCPFYAYDVSTDDVVYAPADPDEGRATFVHVVRKSGNRTVRVLFEPAVEPGNDSDRKLQGLVRLGCSFEGANPSYIVVNIPPQVDLAVIVDYLVGCEVTWEHADPSYSQLYPNG